MACQLNDFNCGAPLFGSRNSLDGDRHFLRSEYVKAIDQ